MYLPHQFIEHQLQHRFDETIRRNYFRGMDFAGPAGDPGWFGPGSAVWHVHSHTEALVFGLQCAAFIERLDPSIYWMGMHHTIKGVRPDGAAYDADDPDWLRWNYATVVWGLATAHELYHPNPLRGKKLDRYYGEFIRVGHALGGTDLPTTKAETLDCLKSYLPKLALTHGAAMATGPNLPLPQSAVDWAVRDTMPRWAKQLLGHTDPNPIERTARRAVVWSIINGLHTAAGPFPEFRQAKARVKGGVDPELAPHTVPAYVPGSDPVRSRADIENAFA